MTYDDWQLLIRRAYAIRNGHTIDYVTWCEVMDSLIAQAENREWEMLRDRGMRPVPSPEH